MHARMPRHRAAAARASKPGRDATLSFRGLPFFCGPPFIPFTALSFLLSLVRWLTVSL